MAYSNYLPDCGRLRKIFFRKYNYYSFCAFKLNQRIVFSRMVINESWKTKLKLLNPSVAKYDFSADVVNCVDYVCVFDLICQ